MQNTEGYGKDEDEQTRLYVRRCASARVCVFAKNIGRKGS